MQNKKLINSPSHCICFGGGWLISWTLYFLKLDLVNVSFQNLVFLFCLVFFPVDFNYHSVKKSICLCSTKQKLPKVFFEVPDSGGREGRKQVNTVIICLLKSTSNISLTVLISEFNQNPNTFQTFSPVLRNLEMANSKLCSVVYTVSFHRALMVHQNRSFPQYHKVLIVLENQSQVVTVPAHCS